MRISNISFLLFSLVFCFFTVNCSIIKGDDKIKLKIEVLKRDELLSPSHLKVQKSIIHNGKKINIKVFEKINQQVLERALIVEEIDKIHSLTKKEKNKLLSLEKSEDDSEEDTLDEEITESEDNEDDGKMKVISTEESKENDIHMIRKIYKETVGNKEITYCYMKFTFNLDLEKLNEVSRSELFKSLDSMPDYLSFLSPSEEVSDTENLLEEEYEQLHNDSTNHSSFAGMSATELIHNSEEMHVNIAKYITTLDDIINYVVNKSEDSFKLPSFYNELLKEREYLYELSLERTENEHVVADEYWKNKSKIDKYFLFEALTHLKNIFFDDMKKRVAYKTLKSDDFSYDSSVVYEKFVDLTDKTVKCHTLLDTTEILDFVILENIGNEINDSENENKTDRELIEQCIDLFKLLLNNREDMIKDIKEKRMKYFMNNGHKAEKEKKKILMMDHGKKVFHDLQDVAKEKFPVKKYMLRKEASDDIDDINDDDNNDDDNNDDDEIIMSLENEESKDDNVFDSSEEIKDNFDGNVDEIGETYEFYEPENEFSEEMLSDMPEKIYKKDHIHFLQYHNEISNNDMTAEMANEDMDDIEDETEEEHKADILEVLNLEKKKLLDADMNQSMESTEGSEERFTDEIISDNPEEENKKNLSSSMEYDNESNNDMRTEMSNEDMDDIEDETEEEHKADILEVLNLEKKKLLDADMNNTINKDIKPHNEMTSSYIENIALVEEDEDDVEDDDSVFSVDDDNDDDDNDNDNSTDSDENIFEDVDEDDDNNTDSDENILDDVDDEDEDNNSDDDDDMFDDVDDEEEEEEVAPDNEKMSDKIKRKAKKEFKKVVKKGKTIAKDALSTLADKAEGQVKKLASKMTNKIKNKLNSSKDKKKEKKNKKKNSKKNSKKTSSKKIKKDKKKEKKNSKSKDDNLRIPAKSKSQKKTKALSSLEIGNTNNTLRRLHRESSFLGLSDTAGKTPVRVNMKKTIGNINSEMSNLENKKKKLLKKLEEPSVSDEKIIDDFEKYSQKEQKKKQKKLKK